MTWAAHLAEGVRPLVDAIYPPRCPICGDGIEQQSGLCLNCWTGLVIPGDPACASCQRPLQAENTSADSQCGACMEKPPRHAGIHAATLYNDASRKLVLSFKHGRRIALAEMMARQMAARLPQEAGDSLLVPVPLHRWRIWKRGFNQAALLARELGRLTGHRVLVDGLVRLKATPSLGGLGRKARERALSGAIGVNPARKPDIEGRHIVLVDDVLTSGATSDAAVSALLRARAKTVRISCFARVLDEAMPRLAHKPPPTKTPEAARTSGAT